MKATWRGAGMSLTKRLLAALALACACATWAGAQTQSELNRRACEGYTRADAELNRVYQQVLDEYKDEAEFLSKLKEAQRAWVAYRDAHVESLYPGEDKRLLYGSAYEMCLCPETEKLTRERTKLLRQWLAGRPEGDVCGGTVKTVETPAPKRRRSTARRPR